MACFAMFYIFNDYAVTKNNITQSIYKIGTVYLEIIATGKYGESLASLDSWDQELSNGIWHAYIVIIWQGIVWI